MIKEYIEYLKDNPEGYWFKRKLYGLGWTPVKWQGWVVVLVSVVFIVWSSLDLVKVAEPSDDVVKWFLIKVVLSVVVMIGICLKKGEKPRWQWGLPKNKNENGKF